ncbi:MAG: isoprenyl transferase [Phycisphaerales bacterium]|nr:MAG: isoprenyl transferase [Phycisphaerales bacterium]
MTRTDPGTTPTGSVDTASAVLGSTALDAEGRAALAAIQKRRPEADPLSRLSGVSPARIPRHIAIIMDGNGRWAQQRGFPREFGHRNGVRVVREVLTECNALGVEVVTLYSFSLENWKRPADEVRALMELCKAYLDGEREEMIRENIRFRTIGRRDGLPAEVLAAIDRMTAETAHCTGSTLCLAINYGSRAEIADAARAIARDAALGRLDPESVDESVFESRLSTAGLPDPDLLIRTAGEMRVSNYLLWQISYAELFVTEVLWPDFAAGHLHEAIREYAGRSRRFGGIDPSAGESPRR